MYCIEFEAKHVYWLDSHSRKYSTVTHSVSPNATLIYIILLFDPACFYEIFNFTSNNRLVA